MSVSFSLIQLQAARTVSIPGVQHQRDREELARSWKTAWPDERINKGP